MKHLKLFSFLVLLSACGEPDKYYSDKSSSGNFHYRYTVYYDESSDITSVTASFFEEEKNVLQEGNVQSSECSVRRSISLQTGSSVSFNDSILIKNGQQYTKEFKGLKAGKFIWKDEKGKEIINEVSAPTKISFPTMTTFNKNFGLSFKWIGEPLKEEEYCLFSIRAKNVERGIPVNSGTTYTISCPVNQTYPDGPATFYISRHKSLRFYKNGKQGEISFKYAANPLSINIISKPEQSDPTLVSIGNNPF